MRASAPPDAGRPPRRHRAAAANADLADPDVTHVGYLDPRELADRYALDGHQQTLERQTAVLTKLAAAAAG